LEIYMNQIYLGQRSYGFASASEIYFGKPLKDVTIAEAAMLAGLPKAPSAYNPISNPKRATQRQLYIIDRLLEHGFISAEQHEAARPNPLRSARQRRAEGSRRPRGQPEEGGRRAAKRRVGDDHRRRPEAGHVGTVRESEPEDADPARRGDPAREERERKGRLDDHAVARGRR